MTRDEFLGKSYAFMTNSKAEAEAEAARYNSIGVEGDKIVAVNFGCQWCVMLGSAFDFVESIGVEGKRA